MDDLVRRGVDEGDIWQMTHYCTSVRHYDWERKVIRETASVSPFPLSTLSTADEAVGLQHRIRTGK